MGGSRRTALAAAAAVAVAVVLSLAGCSGFSIPGASGVLVNAEADGQLIGAAASSATRAPVAPDEHSLNTGWTDSTGCPSAIFDGISAGFGANGVATRTVPSASSGPVSVPTLTSKFVPSCSFTFRSTNALASGLVGRGEIFIGMGQSYDTMFARSLTNAGFRDTGVSGFATTYVRGSSAVDLVYVPQNTQGDPYSVLAVIGVN